MQLRKRIWSACLAATASVSIGAAHASASNLRLFAANQNNGTVSEYDAVSGATLSTNFGGSWDMPEFIVSSGGAVYISEGFMGKVRAYDANTGNPLSGFNTITGINLPTGMALYKGDLYVIGMGNGILSEYNATTGALINPEVLDGTQQSEAMAVVGDNLFITNFSSRNIIEYNLATGTENPTFASGLNSPTGLAVMGNDLYVSNLNNGLVREYDATTGILLSPSLVGGDGECSGLAISGNTLYTARANHNTLGDYNATTGASFNRSFITSGLSEPWGIGIASVPEPTTLGFFGAAGLLMLRRRHQD